MTEQDQVYKYEPEDERKSKIRSIAVLATGSVLGIGFLASAAIGLSGGEPAEIIERVQAKIEQRLSGEDHEEFRPEEESFTAPSARSAEPVGPEGVEPVEQQDPSGSPAPLVAPGFSPQSDDEDEDEDGEHRSQGRGDHREDGHESGDEDHEESDDDEDSEESEDN